MTILPRTKGKRGKDEREKDQQRAREEGKIRDKCECVHGEIADTRVRPSARPSQQATHTPAFVHPNAPPPRIRVNAKQSVHGQLRDGEWSDTQPSRTPTGVRRAKSSERESILSDSLSVRRPRTQSLSTVENQARNSLGTAGEFKIVIDHPSSVSHNGDKVILPTLEVPIPHYRLGSPRFSARGTAFLHSSVYTKTSINDDLGPSALTGAEHEKLVAGTRGVEQQSGPPRRHSQGPTPPPFSVRIAPINEPVYNAAMTSSPAFHRSREPILPSMFDAIAAHPDDPAIVRYASNSREITAASPARIIAQITSQNFLDYELLSDFFLTVRAYLSSHDLLAYLLARFEWAINRFDDDGRVIRVRAFAALRHWILNYFPYDFVIDRDLRVKFCERLNFLSRTVRERSIDGPSDLKLILDLKKCWNGHCALYWDHQAPNHNGRPELDIHPGGIAGSRDSRLTHPSQLWTRAAEPVPERADPTIEPTESASALSHWVDAVVGANEDALKVGERRTSVITSRSLPNSTTSEQSVQAMSCACPGKGLKKAMAQTNQTAGSPSVPMSSSSARKVCPAAPSAVANERPSAPSHAHKRSGSFSDAFRDKRASLPSVSVHPPDEPVMMAFPYSGSLIRGSVVPPGSPYLDATVVPAKSISDLRSLSSSESEKDHPDAKLTSPLAPGVKNLICTIRRVLSNKQDSGAQSSALLANPTLASSKGSSLPSSTVPTDSYVDRRYLDVVRDHTRIDLLCLETLEVYQRPPEVIPERGRRSPELTGLGVETQHRHSPIQDQSVDQMSLPALVRNNSELTTGSRSILVVDDTRNYPPVPTLPSKAELLVTEERLREITETKAKSTATVDPLIPPDYRGGSPKPKSSQAEIRLFHDAYNTTDTSSASTPAPPTGESRPNEESNQGADLRRIVSSHRPSPPLLNRGLSYKSNHSGSKSLRKYASYQSGIARHVRQNSIDAATTSGSIARSSIEGLDKPPGRMLRRRPGGDLRANQNVHDLEQLPRSRSAGSVTVYTDSMRESEPRNSQTTTPNLKSSSQTLQVEPLSIAASTPQKPVSLVKTHSSQPALRASFEAAVAEFARIPEDEGGDIEATLLKLEGKYRKSPPVDHPPVGVKVKLEATDNSSANRPEDTKPAGTEISSREIASVEKNGNHVTKINDSEMVEDHDGDQTPTGDRSQSQRYNMASSLYAESEESYNSTPLLERGQVDKARSKDTSFSNVSKVSVPQPLFSRSLHLTKNNANVLSTAVETAVDFESHRRIRYRSSIPTTTDSFLLDEDEFLSDLSSEISMEMVDHEEARDNVFNSSASLLPPGVTPSTSGNLAASSIHPPTPPMTKESAMALNSQATRMKELSKPPTPDPSPVHRFVEPASSRANDPPPGSLHPQFTVAPPTKLPIYRHLPFILTFDALTIAEQFTIIERDALNEINWQDLINMRWHHTSPSTLNWVDYLRTQQPTGIELVTARFNIMVKWVLSEIVLTQNMEERALAITKYIHIANFARRLNNFATVFQLTIALTSIDCSRLTRTWELVPAAEKRSLKELENLVTPIKNFNNLRQEMETANTNEGCIPVVGKFRRFPLPLTWALHPSLAVANLNFAALYIHDLTYNSQKPSQIASTRDGEPLINFERYRTTASIVKNLLRLIEASAKYTFQPVEGAIERCLWMASLPDEMIRQKSKELE